MRWLRPIGGRSIGRSKTTAANIRIASRMSQAEHAGPAANKWDPGRRTAPARTGGHERRDDIARAHDAARHVGRHREPMVLERERQRGAADREQHSHRCEPIGEIEMRRVNEPMFPGVARQLRRCLAGGGEKRDPVMQGKNLKAGNATQAVETGDSRGPAVPSHAAWWPNRAGRGRCRTGCRRWYRTASGSVRRSCRR